MNIETPQIKQVPKKLPLAKPVEKPKVEPPAPGTTNKVVPPPHPYVLKTSAAYKLSRRMKFRGLDISIETDKGESRHWHDPHNDTRGSTKMKFPYGYIRRTQGTDGDHVDVYVGPNEKASYVYVVHQMKAPSFKVYDEDKCMIGFDSADAAKKAYLQHYNDKRFLGTMTKMPWDEFEKKVLKTMEHPKKIAAYDAEKVAAFKDVLGKAKEMFWPTVETLSSSIEGGADAARKALRNRMVAGAIVGAGAGAVETNIMLPKKRQSTAKTIAGGILGGALGAVSLGKGPLKDFTNIMGENAQRSQKFKEQLHAIAKHMPYPATSAAEYADIVKAIDSRTRSEIALQTYYKEQAAAAAAAAEKAAKMNKTGASLGDPMYWQGGTPQEPPPEAEAEAAAPQEPPPPASAEEIISTLPAGIFQGLQQKIGPDGQKSTTVKVTPDILQQPDALGNVFQSDPGAKVEIAAPDQKGENSGGGQGGMLPGPPMDGAGAAPPPAAPQTPPPPGTEKGASYVHQILTLLA